MPTTAEYLIMAAVLLATLAYEVWLERQNKLNPPKGNDNAEHQ